MRFEFYRETIAAEPKLSVDGTVDNAIHFSHWKGTETPASVKADTSTKIALNVAAAANRDQLPRGIDLVTNNHFDTDGVLSVWTMLNGERALQLCEKLFGLLVRQLNDIDKSTTGRWQIDNSELSSAIKFRDDSGKLAASKLTPDIVASHFRVAVSERLAAEAAQHGCQHD